MLDVCNNGCILKLHKQRFLYHSCNKKFFARTKIVNDGCFISNQVKYAIALELKNKIIFTDGEASMPDMSIDATWIVFGGEKINPKGGKVIHITPEQLDRLYSYEIESETKGRSR